MDRLKRLIILLYAVLCSSAIFAQRVTASVDRRQVEVGQQFHVMYVVTNGDVDYIKLNSDFQGCTYLYGPSRSVSKSQVVVNGKLVNNDNSMTFTYTLKAAKAGTFTLPSATIQCGGKSLKTNSPQIQILPATSQSNQQNSRRNPFDDDYDVPQSKSRVPVSKSFHTATSGETIDPSNLYITATASKQRVYEQEAFVVTYKLYSLYNFDSVEGEIPQLDGFHTQEIMLPEPRQVSLEHVNGKNMGTAVWRQYVLFPQKSGTLTIPAVDHVVDVIVQDRSSDPIDAIFNGGGMSKRVKKVVKAPAIQIQVEALPDNKPANFSGTVGRGLSISGKLTPQQIDANDATSLVITLSGTGNLKLMSAPSIAWPKDFETYDPKSTDELKLTSNGQQGKIMYEYQAVPYKAGKYEIPEVEFCYFDLDTRQYKTIKTNTYSLNVTPGAGGSLRMSQEDLEELGSDIRYIKTAPFKLDKSQSGLWLTLTQLFCYVGLLVCFVLAILSTRFVNVKLSKSNSRVNRAGKTATKRLRQAHKLMMAKDSNSFYDEALRALWGYVADRLNLPVTDLNKDNVSDMLSQKGIDEETVKHLLDVLSECEFARYAPGDPESNMLHLYDSASEVITQLDSKL